MATSSFTVQVLSFVEVQLKLGRISVAYSDMTLLGGRDERN